MIELNSDQEYETPRGTSSDLRRINQTDG
jgi:hypothetical protein